jgi:hypothetical protein
MSLNDLVNVKISRQTAAIGIDSLTIPAILSSECNFTDRARSYGTTLSALAADLVGGASSITYQMAAILLGQEKTPSKFKILNQFGKRYFGIQGTMYLHDSIYVTVNGVKYTATWDGSTNTTQAATVTALFNAVAAGTTNLTCTAIGTVIMSLYATSGNMGIALGAFGTTIYAGNLTTFTCFPMNPLIVNVGATSTYTGGAISGTLAGVAFSVPYASGPKDTVLSSIITALTTLNSNIVGQLISEILYLFGLDGTLPAVTLDFTGCTGTINAKGTATYPVNTGMGVETINSTLFSAITLVDASWYGLLWDGNGQLTDYTAYIATQMLIAGWTETNQKWFAARSKDLNIANQAVGTDTTSIAAQAKTNSYTRTSVWFHSKADQNFIDAAVVGTVSPRTPGSYTVKFKTLAGVAIDSLTPNQITNIEAKNANDYISIANLGMTEQGTMSLPEWIDTIIGIDWITMNIQTNVFSSLKNAPKVPFDDTGITMICNGISAALDAGISSGLLTKMLRDINGNIIGGYVITPPAASTISANSKNSRTLPGIPFTAYLAGAIHSVTINGIVTV